MGNIVVLCKGRLRWMTCSCNSVDEFLCQQKANLQAKVLRVTPVIFCAQRVLSVEECEYKIYQGKFFERLIIPDIILTRTNGNGENEYMVFDAKYKRMRINKESKGYDVDRTDLFQIHTYIQFVEHHLGHVVVGGLLYPLTRKVQDDNGNEIEIDIDTDKFHSASLYGKECGLFPNTTFIIDGVICSECDNAEGNDKYTNLDDNVEAMIARIKGYVEQ